MWITVYSVTGDSMVPSLRAADRLIVVGGRGCYPARGDLVVLRSADDGERRYVKRVIGLPGEEVTLPEGLLLVNGKRLREPYLRGLPASPGLGESRWSLGREEYFVMGDNRAHSTDSRSFGPVALGQIEGRARLRVWPLSRLGRLQRSGAAIDH